MCHFRRPGIHPFSNLKDVVIKEANQVRSTNYKGLVTNSQSKAACVKIVVDAARDAVLTIACHVDAGGMDAGGNHGFGRTRAQIPPGRRNRTGQDE